MSFLRKRAKSLRLRVMPFPQVYGPAFAAYYASLMASQWCSLDELRQLQFEDLQRIVRHAHEYVPYYRRILDQMGFAPKDLESLEDLDVIPSLDKRTLRDHFEELVATNAADYQPVTVHTSGSTGIPQKLLHDRDNLAFENAAIWRHFDWAGYRHKARMAVLRGKVVPGDRFWYKPDAFTLTLSSYKLARSTLEHYITALRQFQPAMIRAYPSTVFFLAQLLERQGVDDIRPRSIVTASETLLPHQRTTVERVFGCKILDWYGSGEHVAIISQCPAGKYHVHMEYGIVEYLRRPELDREDEAAYEIVCTGLHNFSLPLLRYRIGDVVFLRQDETCDCGRGLPVVSAVEGRLDSAIVTPDGRTIPASGMTLAFEFSETISQAQIYQETVDELTIRVVRSAGYSEQDHEFMLDQVRGRIGEAMRIRVDFVDEIPRLPSGKQPFAISKATLD